MEHASGDGPTGVEAMSLCHHLANGSAFHDWPRNQNLPGLPDGYFLAFVWTYAATIARGGLAAASGLMRPRGFCEPDSLSVTRLAWGDAASIAQPSSARRPMALSPAMTRSCPTFLDAHAGSGQHVRRQRGDYRSDEVVQHGRSSLEFQDPGASDFNEYGAALTGSAAFGASGRPPGRCGSAPSGSTTTGLGARGGRRGPTPCSSAMAANAPPQADGRGLLSHPLHSQ